MPANTMFVDNGIDLSSSYTKYFNNMAGLSASGSIVYDPTDSSSMYISAVGFFSNVSTSSLALVKLSRATGVLSWKKHITCDIATNFYNYMKYSPDVIYHPVSNKIYMSGVKTSPFPTCIGAFDSTGAVISLFLYRQISSAIDNF